MLNEYGHYLFTDFFSYLYMLTSVLIMLSNNMFIKERIQ